MALCEWCGNVIDEDEVNDFCDETGIWTDYIKKELCKDCLEQAWEDDVDGIFYDKCEECGCEFDIIEANSYFNSDSSVGDLYRSDVEDKKGKTLCASCALGYIDEMYDDQKDYEEDDDESEDLSVEDAALIWESNGYDADYMYGYSEEELRDALD